MEQIFLQLAIILSTAFIISYIIRLFNQPVIIGYIIAGIITAFIISSGFINMSADTEIIHLFSKLGITFLLFIVGLHLNPKVIKEIGFFSLFIGLGQIILTFGITFFISSTLLGFGTISSLYIGIALAFSSTIITMKLLSDKRQLDSLYGKISIGILIIQDLVAILILLFISSMSEKGTLAGFAIHGLIGGASLMVFLFLIGFFILPPLTRKIARSQELLFLFSICWCFVLAALFNYLGFSIEIGALVAGVILSTSKYSTEISAKIRPLRDFFLIIFFIILGLGINISNLDSIIINALILSLIALVIKPLIIMVLMAIAGYTKRTNFLVGTTLSQISEFSLIIAGLGIALGQIKPEILNTLTLTLAITIVFSTYLITYSKDFYRKMYGFISIFEKKKHKKDKKINIKYDAILFGYNRIGFSILRSLKKIKKRYLIIDYNPDTISSLTKLRIPCVYGDIDDPELLRDLPLDKIKLAVSTIPDYETNLLLVKNIRTLNSEAIIITRAHQIEDALDLYQKGASYVLTPHFLGGEYVSDMIKKFKLKTNNYEEERNKHIKMLKEIEERGYKHPEVEKN